MKGGNDSYFGFDFNGDGNVSLEESMLTLGLISSVHGSGEEDEDDFDDTDDEDEESESDRLMASFHSIADKTNRAYGAKPIYTQRIPGPETGAFYQFTNRHPVLYYFLMMAGVVLLWLIPDALLDAGAVGGAIVFCAIVYPVYFFLLFFAMNRSEKAYKREEARLAEEAEREERARGLRDPADYTNFVPFYVEILNDFEGERKQIPAEYLPYFLRNFTAFQYWAVGWIREQQIKAGLYPWKVPRESFDKRVYQPYKVFEALYLRKIRELNTTGTFLK